MDTFLIATGLLVFSVSLYELALGELNLPDWMLAHNLHELKSKLSSIIILVMAVFTILALIFYVMDFMKRKKEREGAK